MSPLPKSKKRAQVPMTDGDGAAQKAMDSGLLKVTAGSEPYWPRLFCSCIESAFTVVPFGNATFHPCRTSVAVTGAAPAVKTAPALKGQRCDAS
jgi:hypothetical protein